MNPSRTSFKLTALVMAAVVLLLSSPSGLAQAGLVATEQVVAERAPHEDRAHVLNFLQREDVRKHLARLGVNPDEAVARVSALSDAEVRQVAGQVDRVPAGQDGTIGIIVGAIVLIFIILLLTDLLGLTDIFPFVKKSKR